MKEYSLLERNFAYFRCWSCAVSKSYL